MPDSQDKDLDLQDDPDIDVDDADLDSDQDTDDSKDSDSDDPIAAFRKELDERDQRLEGQLRDFSRAVGRLQSAASKAVAAPQGIAPELQEQLQASYAMLDSLIDGLDETAVDPAVRKQLQGLREKRRQLQAEADIDRRVEEKVRKALPQPQGDPEESAVAQALLSFQHEVEDEIEAYGLDPDDFDWEGEATTLLRTKGFAATRTYFRQKIQENLRDTAATERRQARKGTADKPVPKAAGGSKESDVARLSNPKTPFAERYEILRRMGAVK